MIRRVVKMSFQNEKINEFISNFEANKEKIRNFPGCSHLELWRDLKETNVFFTYSNWESEEALNKYRNSELFKGVWKKTKVLFNDKPLAWSLDGVYNFEC